MSSLKQLKVVKSSISGRVEVELSCSAMMLSTMLGVMPLSEVVFKLTELCHDEWCHIEWFVMLLRKEI